MNLIEYPDADLMMMDLADGLASALKSALLTHEEITFAVPGGTTPGPLFDTLAAVHLDWDRVTVLPSDERWVPEDQDRSNARLIRQRLLTGTAAAAKFMSLYRPEGSPEDALPELASALEPKLPLNLLLLGMGEDMHTASLFPGVADLGEALAPHAPPLVVMRPDGQPEARISLSGPVLSGAMNTHVVIVGDRKRAALEKAVKLQPIDAPVQTVLTNATVHWAA